MAVAPGTEVALSAADRDEPRHSQCAQIMRTYRGKLVMAAPVVAKSAWMIESRLGPVAEARFLRLVTSSELDVIDLSLDNYRRCIELIETYAGLGLGLVDASVVTVAERLGIATLATLNRRDFTVVRPRHCEAFELVP